MMVAGMVAIGLLALTRAANALDPMWFIIKYVDYCVLDHWVDSNGGNHTTLTMVPFLQEPSSPAVRPVFGDSIDISAIAQMCKDNALFEVYWDGNAWKYIWVLNATPLP
jgi:hypothetical protein